MRNYKGRFIAAVVILVSITGLLVFRLWYLQVMTGGDYEKFSRNNRIRFVRTPAPRGRIFDRHGRELVINRSSFDVYIDPDEKADEAPRNRVLAGILDKDPAEIMEKLAGVPKRGRFRPLLIEKDISRDQLALIEARRSSYLRGVQVEVNHVRLYPHGTLGASFLGYMGKATERDMERNDKIYADDFVGKIGLEKSFEDFLRGTDGFVQKISDALGREVRGYRFQEGLRNIKSHAGADVTLSIDLDIQGAAEAALGERSGAIIVVDVRSGEILALVSHPTFNPGDFIAGIPPERWKELSSDRGFPLLNRATQGIYAPGSVFKVVTASAALEEGVITTESVEFCPGHFQMGKSTFRCWKRHGHGWLNLRQAIVQSCDVYFYKTADKLGIDRFSRYIKAFGFGSPTRIDIAEKKGLAPSREWKKKAKKRAWYRGDTILTAIGQGYVNATPLQIAMMTASIANGGTLYKPHLVKKIVSKSGETILEFKPNAFADLGVSPESLAIIRSALEGVVNEPLGTGRNARLDDVLVSGKTGTAQVVSNAARKDLPEHEDHAWFTSFAPSRTPEIAVTVFVEHGGGGGRVAAPIARSVLEYYFWLKKQGGSV